MCRACKNTDQRQRYERYKRDSYFTYKATRSRVRAKLLAVPFDLDPEYLESIWTGICPISGETLTLDDRSDEAAAELDRFRPDLGYVRGNVAFVSRRMNRIKNNTSVADLRQLLVWMEAHDGGG